MKIEKLQKGNQLQFDIQNLKERISIVNKWTAPSYNGCGQIYSPPSEDVKNDIEQMYEASKKTMLKKLNAKLAELETEFEKL